MWTTITMNNKIQAKLCRPFLQSFFFGDGSGVNVLASAWRQTRRIGPSRQGFGVPYKQSPLRSESKSGTCCFLLAPCLDMGDDAKDSGLGKWEGEAGTEDHNCPEPTDDDGIGSAGIWKRSLLNRRDRFRRSEEREAF